jgi:GNAT superfamily N-acetyltransferase
MSNNENHDLTVDSLRVVLYPTLAAALDAMQDSVDMGHQPPPTLPINCAGPVAVFHELFIQPRARGKGHARRIVAEAERRATAAGSRCVLLQAIYDDTTGWSGNFWNRMGYKEWWYSGGDTVGMFRSMATTRTTSGHPRAQLETTT